MVNLGPIDFQLGLLLHINVNGGQYKFGVHFSNNLANFRPKIGQDATFAQTLYGHYSVFSYPILAFDHTKMTSSARRTQIFVFLSIFVPRTHMGSIGHMDPKRPSSCWYMSRPFPQVIAQNRSYFSFL